MLDAKCIIPEEAFATVPLMNTKPSFKALQGPMGKVFKMTGKVPEESHPAVVFKDKERRHCHEDAMFFICWFVLFCFVF